MDVIRWERPKRYIEGRLTLGKSNALIRDGLSRVQDFLYLFGGTYLKRGIFIVAGLYLKRGTPIIVYQMGKVGSSSITDSLMSCQGDRVFQVHIVNPDHLRELRKELLDKNLRSPPHLTLGQMVYRRIIRRDKKAKVITLVREVIGANLSGFFQNFRRFTGVEYDDANFTVEELVDMFFKNHDHRYPLRWFDVEIKGVLGIDVYEYPFPKERGYLSISKGNFDLLILKSEIDDSTKEKAITEFLGIDNFKLTRTNVAQNKNYANTYQDFVQSIKLPESYIERMCNSKYMRHFYSDAEIERIRSRWNKTSSAGKTR